MVNGEVHGRKCTSLYADGNKLSGLWYDEDSLADKCESFGFKLRD